MNDDILSVIYLLLILAFIVPGFIYANRNKKNFINHIFIWLGIIGLIVIFYKYLFN
tara:strand:- start:194 stop:361 length:168 start_codon:yes stop_codon:yes gene_type:complete